MILKKIKTEHTDGKTGLVLKRITTSEWETFNRKVAINNSMFSCEKKERWSVFWKTKMPQTAEVV